MLAQTRQRHTEALRRYNEVWRKTDHPEYAVRLDAWADAQSRTLPDALWHIGPDHGGEWHGLPYGLLYLQWESHYPDEWWAHSKHWGTKKGLLDHPEAARPKSAQWNGWLLTHGQIDGQA
jgi:hypothetical protein